jgi:DNA polymerase III delta subunit
MTKRKYFTDLWSELKKPDAKLRTAYLLYGPEEFLARKAVERIGELCGDVMPFDYVEALGSESGLAEVADELNTPPMAALCRLVVIRQAEKLLAKAYRGGKISREAVFLRETLSQSDCTGCLVLLASPDVTLGSMPGGKFREAIPTYGSYPLRDAQLVQWVRRGAEERRLAIGREVIVRLISAVGNSLMDLENELEKYVAYLGEEGVVTLATVADLSGSRGGEIKDFLDSVAQRDVSRAMVVLEHLLLGTRDKNRLFPALSNLFGGIHEVLVLPSAELMKNLPRWKLNELRGNSRGWTPESVTDALDGLFRAEWSWKSGRASIDQALVGFVLSLHDVGTAGS